MISLFIDLWGWTDHYSMQAWILQFCILNTAILLFLLCYTFGLRLKIRRITPIMLEKKEPEEIEEKYDFPGASNQKRKNVKLDNLEEGF